MTLADFCEYCQSLPGVEGSTPFGPEVLVYKVGGKMFALAVPEEGEVWAKDFETMRWPDSSPIP